MVRSKSIGSKKAASSSQPKKSTKRQRLDIREPSPDPALQSDSESEEQVPLRNIIFVDKRVMGGRNIDLAFCSSEFSFVSWLEDLHLIPLVQISDPFYIKLVKEFYMNLRIVSSPNEEFALSSTVKGQHIYLDSRILASIPHIPHIGLYIFFPLLMLKTMVRAFSQKKSVLPFGSILTKVFQHHQIWLEGEIATKLKKEDTYNKSTMNRMGWKK
ncbi:hypothetical protein CFOL_v3_09828 [Cephalotus follicularis]|uniref:Uncharacterized protein n=1 Tax=Cephalotus follicularis TaxID=3775 RepID=A0A1Q3BEE1_CEPFO|nr:hypothetical protein CFOL_v3_09828 [Cephalotus follicularis]